MQVSLVFPPSWIPSQPFLSLPSLQGFLKKEGVANVSICDMNIEIMDALLSSEQVKKTHANIIERLSNVTNPFGRESNDAELFSRLEWARDVIEGENMVQNVEWAKANLRSEGFYNLDGYVESWKIIDRWLQAFGMLYYPSEISIADNSMRYSVYSSVDVMSASEDILENPYRDLFKEYVLGSIVSEEPGLVGISVTATSQVMPAFTLARLLKEVNRDIHITMGGSVFLRSSLIIFRIIIHFSNWWIVS